MPEAKVLFARRMPATREDRIGKFDRVIIYEYPAGNRRTLILPDETFNATMMPTYLKKDLEEHGALEGKTFTI